MPSNNKSQIQLPQYIDEPPQFLLWSADEFAPIGLGLFIGILIGSPILMTMVGIFMTNLYRRYRDGRPDGYILHFLYWVGLVPSNARTAPNPFIRRFF